MGTILQDLRFALRQLRKNPGFTFTAVVIFALGIGASTAIFAFVDAALVKPLPYRDPSGLVALYERIPVGDRYHLSYGDYFDWKHLNRSFTSLDVYVPYFSALKTGSATEEVASVLVSDGFFRTLGIPPLLGRDFMPGEDLPSAQQTAMLSYAAWQRRFAANKRVLGQTITLDGIPVTIVGILPPTFEFAPAGPAEFWVTLHSYCADIPRACHPYVGVARLKEGVSVSKALADISGIATQIAARYPQFNRDRSASVLPLADAILGDIRPTLIALLAGAGLLSLIGFVNVSSLLLVRAESRRREFAVRGALGAGRVRLLLQFVVEGFLLAGCGGLIGMGLALIAIRVLPGQIPSALLDNMPYLQALRFDLYSLFFAVSLSIFGGILFAAGPALRLLLADMQEGLLEGGRTAAGRGWRRLGAGLVVVELAITVVLLVSAGLLAKSFYLLLHTDLGISPDHLAVLHVVKPGASSTEKDYIAIERQIISRLSNLPGVTSVGVSRHLAVGSGDGFSHFKVIGRAYAGQGDEANDRIASVGYFETLQARLLRGRYFTEVDDASKPRVGIINQTMAKQEFAGTDPLGQRIVSEYDQEHPIEIVGVIDDIKEGPLDMQPTAAVYEPFNQDVTNDFYVTLRTSQPAESILHSMVRVVHDIEADLIADDEGTMSARISDSQAAYLHRCAAWLVGGFAALALLLGTVGLYGVISYSVGQRTREIGVRMALGAQRASVYRLILREACWLAALGVVGGIVCSFAATSLLRSMLFGVSPRDAGTAISVVCVLAASALLASFIPARRAASIDPAKALRTE